MGKSVAASQDFRKEFYQMSMRPTVLSNQSQKVKLENLEDSIDRHQQEIALLKEKLEFKNKI